MLLSEFLRESERKLSALYPAAEAGNMALMLCEERLGIKSYTVITEPEYRISASSLEVLNSDMLRLLQNEPLQYVLGKAFFYGREFRVAPGVLIPRPETEILVQMALEKPFARALDLCTGSGCIAWTLALERPGAKVIAVDISEKALGVAECQNFEGGVRPEFVKADVLGRLPINGKFDLIVSNPPYIMEKEKADMRPNVLEYEPGLALFVPDDDPLVFYRAIARCCRDFLSDNGRGIVEINEKLGAKTMEIFKKEGFFDVKVVPDLCGRDRYIAFFYK